MRGTKLGVYEKAFVGLFDRAAFLARVLDTGLSLVDLPIDEIPERAARLDWDRATHRPACDAAADAQVQIGGLCLSLCRSVVSDSVDPEMQRCAANVYRKDIHLISDLGIGVVRVVGHYAYYEPADPGAQQRYVDTLLDAVPHTARGGIMLGIENVGGNSIASIPGAVELVELADSP